MMVEKNRLLDTNFIIYQNTDWFKFSLDSVLLAKFVTINLRHKRLIDFATGNAPIPLLLSFRTKSDIFGVEVQENVYNLGLQSVMENDKLNQIHLINGDVNNVNSIFESETFDVVTCNPPYFKFDTQSIVNYNNTKALARHEMSLTLKDVLVQAKYLLRTGGFFAMVHRTERFVEIIEFMKTYNLEPKKLQFIYPKKGCNSDLFLIEGVKNGKIGMKLLPPLIVHNDDNTYTDEILEMLKFE